VTDRYPGYDVLAKRGSPSWNAKTRAVIDERLALNPDRHVALDDAAWSTLKALCARITPQAPDRPPIPVAAMIDEKIARKTTDGYRDAHLPPVEKAWSQGLQALDAEAQTRHGRPFHALNAAEQDGLLEAVQRGYVSDPAWGNMPPALFFKKRVVHDILSAYYAHPTAWNEIGFGGPAAPRGYVRLGFDQRDPWEAVEAKPGKADKARRENTRVGRV
jgi:hypothetical protein